MSSKRMSYRASSISDNGVRVLPEIFKHRLLATAEETLNSMQKIWKEAGYEEIECQRLLGELLNKLKALLTAELAAEQQILEHAKAEVDAKTLDYSTYCSQLGRLPAINHLRDLNYTDRLAELEKVINNISTEVSEREGLLNVEQSKINDLSACLGESIPSDSQFDGPAGTPKLSDVRLNLMRQYIVELENTKTKRIEEVKSIAKDCFKHMTDLMYAEEGFKTMEDSSLYLSLDKQIDRFGRIGEFSISLHKKSMQEISARLKSFIEEKEKRRVELGEVGAEIARLWTLLRVPSIERDAFQASFKMNLSMETLCKGFDELTRLKEVRKMSVGKVVGSIREDIDALWHEAGIELEDTRRSEFPLYFKDVDTLDDRSVDLHESYCNSLRKRVEELRPLLQKISRREAIVQERIELEHIQQNPERLTARGPNAREERKKEEYMSNRVKNLDKVTKELLGQISTWEESNGPFMFGGDRYCDRVQSQDDAYLETRDSLRNARKKKDGKLEQVVTSKAQPSTKKPLAPSNAPPTVLKSSSSSSSSAVKCSAVPSTPTHERHLSPRPQQRAIHSSAVKLQPVAVVVAPTEQQENSENLPPPVAGTNNQCSGSPASHQTSITDLKQRNLSTDSHTVVRDV